MKVPRLYIYQLNMKNEIMILLSLELGKIMIISFIMILKCHNNRYWREILGIVILSTQYYHTYHDYHNIHCSERCTSVKCFSLIFTFLVVVVLLSDIVIILIIVIINLVIYCNMKFLVLPIPSDHRYVLTHYYYQNRVLSF